MKPFQKPYRRIGIVAVMLCGLFQATAAQATLPKTRLNWLGAGRHQMRALPMGTAMPAMDTVAPDPWTPSYTDLNCGEATVDWSNQDLPDWKTYGKVTAPRVALAKLAANRDIEATNQYLLDNAPWSGVGSSWLLFKGDYDFTLATLTTILYLFGNNPDRLYPETRQHLLDVLLTEEGDTPLVTAPLTFGLVLDTENHHLMTEGSRYLKNQWLRNHGTDAQRHNPLYDNEANGMAAWLSEYLDLMIHEGVYEFNSNPYAGYTLQALLNLEAFPESPVIRSKAQYILDIVNLQYALSSLDLRRDPPFRRRYTRKDNPDLTNDPHSAYALTWLELGGATIPPEWNSPGYSGHALLAELLPYRLPKDVAAWTLRKPFPYFVRFGRGPTACPEIYSGGPGYLLSAGGANRGFRSHIIARPITLFLSDGAAKIQNCFHIRGKGPWYAWNNTGVYSRFACTNGAVHIPAGANPEAEGYGWRIFRVSEPKDLLIAVYEDDHVGLLSLFPECAKVPDALLNAILDVNADTDLLRSRYVQPDGPTLEYDPNAPKGLWVMKSADGQALDRAYDRWPQFTGDLPALSFAR